MMKLSIIVPIYGVERYLRKCVDSLLAQDLPSSEYEIILVDDGSPDGCPAICDQYAAEHDNIRVIHRKNGGLSAARNSGIEVAQGEYVMFVDSDDYLEPNVLGYLVHTIEAKNLDVLRYNYQNVRIANGQDSRVESEYMVFEPHKNSKPYFDYSDDVVDGEEFLNERLGYACYACAFILRRDLIYTSHITHHTSNILFTEKIYFEDTDWTPRMLIKAKRVSSTDKIIYNYLWREGSITLPTSPEKRQKIFDDRMKLLYGIQEQSKLVKDDRWFMWHIATTAIAILNAISTYPKYKRKQYLQELISLDIFPLSTYRAVRNNKYKIRLANISPRLYCWVMNVIHRLKV